MDILGLVGCQSIDRKLDECPINVAAHALDSVSHNLTLPSADPLS